VLYSGSVPPTVPFWEERWPGRFKYELDQIAEHAVGDIVMDDDALAKRQLRIRFEWPTISKGTIALEATFPNSFPRLRPVVTLRTDPETFPERHVGPNGEVCLLGRDSRFWGSSYTLAKLLLDNLDSALTNTGVEDLQGEPAEVWWNTVKRYDYPNYLLIDSAWDLSSIDSGTAEIAYHFELVGKLPQFRAVLNRIRSPDGITLVERDFAVPKELESSKIKQTKAMLRRQDDLPKPSQDRYDALLQRIDHNGWHEKTTYGNLRVSLTLQKTELQHAVEGDSVICVVSLTRGGGGKAVTSRFNVPVYRAGPSDIGHRVPSTLPLRNAAALVVGLGALGSPLAIELARNGIAKLALIDHDVVEPGNSVRWALGASAWGERKSNAIGAHIRAEYPWTKVNAFTLNIGFPLESEDETAILCELIQQVDVVIDASASVGVTNHLSDECRRLGKTLVSAAGTLNLRGGTVSVYRPGSGCPICRDHAYFLGQLARAPGADDSTELIQPPGCSENTFTGASYDLQELSTQAVRATVQVLDGTASDVSTVQTLSLHDGTRRILPLWSQNELPALAQCGCTR
jgi:hypothetical protein